MPNMGELQPWLIKARNSKSACRIVNFLFWRLIPFNRPHGITIHSVGESEAVVRLPFRKRNCNHLKSIHACALATAAEFSAGVAILQVIDPAEFRLIMKRMEVDYISQARKAVLAKAKLDGKGMAAVQELSDSGIADIEMEVEVHDVSEKEICRVRVFWQLKNWSQVKSSAA